MDGSEFIDLAAKMALAANTNAAGYRTVVSRAYYGAFHLARRMLNEIGFRCRVRDNEHLFVQRHFANCREPKAQEAGRLLGHLHENRKEADYDLHKPQAETQWFALLCVKRADRLRDHLNHCRSQETLAKVISEMTAYRTAANIT
jgi:uncharacterized protein (UPF0332 family)